MWKCLGMLNMLLQGERLDLSGDKSGLLASDNLLAIQKVRVDQGGSYACSATNSLATNTSNQLLIDVKCKTSELSKLARNLDLIFQIGFLFQFPLTR